MEVTDDSATIDGQIPSLLSQEEPENRQASQPRHLFDKASRRATRARGAIFQTQRLEIHAIAAETTVPLCHPREANKSSAFSRIRNRPGDLNLRVMASDGDRRERPTSRPPRHQLRQPSCTELRRVYGASQTSREQLLSKLDSPRGIASMVLTVLAASFASRVDGG